MKISELKNKIIKKYGKKGWQRLKKLEEYKMYVALEEKQIESVKEYPFSIKYMNNPSENILLEAVRRFPNVIQYINNPSERVQLEAIKYNSFAIEQIHNPSDKVLQEAIKQIEKEEDSIGIYKILFRYLENDLKEKESKEDKV